MTPESKTVEQSTAPVDGGGGEWSWGNISQRHHSHSPRASSTGGWDRCLKIWKYLLSDLVICDAKSQVYLLNIKKSSQKMSVWCCTMNSRTEQNMLMATSTELFIFKLHLAHHAPPPPHHLTTAFVCCGFVLNLHTFGGLWNCCTTTYAQPQPKKTEHRNLRRQTQSPLELREIGPIFLDE